MRHAPKVLLAGFAVYLAMAACSAAGRSFPGATRDPDAEAELDETGDVITKAVDALVDGVKNPVGEAAAAPEIATEPCDKTNGSYVYAEHDFPGRSKTDLARVLVLIEGAPAPPVPGYTSYLQSPYIKDGAVIAICGSSAAAATSATFILNP